MNIKSKEHIQLILNSSNCAHIYNFLAAALVAGGLINLAARKSELKTNFSSVMALTFFLFFLGIIIKIIQKINLPNKFKDIFTLALISLSIPLITLQFVKFAGITVWAFPFVLIIIFTMFNNRRMLIFLSASILITQAAVWILSPNVAVAVEPADYLARIMLYIIALWLAFYVNNIYLSRLNENSHQLLIQKNITEISTDFITADYSNIDEKIMSMLKKTGHFLSVDQSYVFILNIEEDTIKCSHSCFNDNCKVEMDLFQNLKLSMFPWLLKQLIIKGELIHISNLEMMPKEAAAEKKFFEALNIKSVIASSLPENSNVRGFLSFASVNSKTNWDEDHINALKIMSNLTSNALSKIKSEKKLEYIVYYDQLTSLPNRTLFKNRLNYAVNIASRSNESLAVMFLDLDSFKNINDTLGHEFGDVVLKMAASRLINVLRKSDTVSRFGGDEFLILINNVSTTEDIKKVANNVLSIFNNPFNINGQDIHITASAGIAVYPADGDDVDTLIKNADIAMYNAKEHGKEQYRLCNSNMKSDIQNSVELTNSMYRLQDRNEL